MAMSTSTGGFVTRTERTGTLEHRSATGVLGPGDYNVDSRAESIPAPVPFHTSAEKVLLENTATSAITPGVGAYNAALAHDMVQTKHILPTGSTANFNSGTSRLHEDKGTHVAVPGPGSYPEGNGWIKKPKHFKAPQPAQRISFARVPSAPSIPAGHQSYGYEEGDSGLLIMQKSPDPIHTGEGRDTVGPGSYNISPAVLGEMGKASKAVGWGKSKAKKGLEFKSIAPGPGAYNPSKGSARSHSSPIVVAVNGVEVQFGGTNGTAQFVSRVPLSSQRMPTEHEKTPGPGAYNESRVIAAKAQPLPEELQCFSSTAKRHSTIDPTKSLAAPTYFRNPGPGAYDDPRRSIAVSQQSWAPEPLPFHSTGNRFGKDDNGVPGPGEYRPDAVVSILKAQQDKAAVCKAGVFGTLSTRFPARQDQEQGALPGPGNYEPKLDASPPRHRGDQATFASKTSRFRSATAPPASIDKRKMGVGAKEELRGDPAMLGPGRYEAPDPWASKARHPGFKKTAFGSDGKRLQQPQGTPTPGPGRYKQGINMDQVYQPFTVPPKETVFGCQTARFKGPGSFTPGPGQYVGQGDFVRRSHNITYTGQQAELVS